MDVVAYMKGKAPLEEREQKLFELINELELDSNKLFDEVVNTNIESIFRLVELLNECKNITVRYKELYDSYSLHLKDIN